MQWPGATSTARTGTPCKVRPLVEEQEKGARAAVRRARKIVMVTNIETGRQTVRMRGADRMSERGGQETRNVYEGAGGEEQRPRIANRAPQERRSRQLDWGRRGRTTRIESAQGTILHW